jgi:hypothetical protein
MCSMGTLCMTPFSFPMGPEVWHTGWASYQGMAHAPFTCLSSFKAWVSDLGCPRHPTPVYLISVSLVSFHWVSLVPVLSDQFLSPNFQSQLDRRKVTMTFLLIENN